MSLSMKCSLQIVFAAPLNVLLLEHAAGQVFDVSLTSLSIPASSLRGFERTYYWPQREALSVERGVIRVQHGTLSN
jgi:hypothetical protein